MTGFFDPYDQPSTVAGADKDAIRIIPAGPAPDPGICGECVALVHYWSQPNEQIIELAGELFSVMVFRCICECGCPAILSTTLPHQPKHIP